MGDNDQRQHAGLISTLRLEKFGPKEAEIVHNLSSVWFVTRAELAQWGNDRFYSVFLKPTDELLDRFHLFGNVLCVLHPYNRLDGRVFQLIERQLSSNQYRLDKLCVLLISNATSVEEDVKRISAESEARIVVPFRYQEWSGGVGGKRELTLARIQAHLYTRNLFGMSSALKTDRYFFGRKADIQRIIGKYQAGENASIFGLRRIGKTSVLWAVVRELNANGSPVAFIDCSDSKYHKQSWNHALFQIKESLFDANQLSGDGNGRHQYSEENASIAFQQDLVSAKKRFGKPSLLIFDEVENLCFDLSPTRHWASGEHFLLFWQTIRSIYQQNPNLFSFLLCGVNPKATETAILRNGKDNPLYRYIEPDYLGFFDVDDVGYMVGIIGGYMGMEFDKEIFTYLTDDYGGHPFLIRQICSQMYKAITSSAIPRQVRVRKEFYREKKNDFAQSVRDYIDLILRILIDRYPNEYKLLQHLSAGDSGTFNTFAAEDGVWTEHLLGYGLICKVRDKYHFRLSVVEDAVRRESKHLQSPDTVEDRWRLLSEHRNSLETRIRELVRAHLKICLGVQSAKDAVMEVLRKPNQKRNAESMKYDQIFEAELYFSDLRRAIEMNWEIFTNIFRNDLSRFSSAMREINTYRADAHATTITRDQFSSAMSALAWLRESLDENS